MSRSLIARATDTVRCPAKMRGATQKGVNKKEPGLNVRKNREELEGKKKKLK